MAENSAIKSYRDLNIWKRAKSHVVLIYKVTEKFPSSELYGLTSQMRRAAVSVPSNIAEGFRRNSKKEKLQFLRTAFGSGAELETQLEISFELGYLHTTEYGNLAADLDGIMRMINKAISALDAQVL